MGGDSSEEEICNDKAETNQLSFNGKEERKNLRISLK